MHVYCKQLNFSLETIQHIKIMTKKIPERYSVFFLQSQMSISAVPAITSSNSRASNTDTRRGSTTCKMKNNENHK